MPANATTVLPAYGRDYKTAAAARDDWTAGLDFIVADFHHPADGRAVNCDDGADERWKIRYDSKTQIGPLNF